MSPDYLSHFDRLPDNKKLRFANILIVLMRNYGRTYGETQKQWLKDTGNSFTTELGFGFDNINDARLFIEIFERTYYANHQRLESDFESFLSSRDCNRR
jgi:hypothetical protein